MLLCFSEEPQQLPGLRGELQPSRCRALCGHPALLARALQEPPAPRMGPGQPGAEPGRKELTACATCVNASPRREPLSRLCCKLESSSGSFSLFPARRVFTQPLCSARWERGSRGASGGAHVLSPVSPACVPCVPGHSQGSWPAQDVLSSGRERAHPFSPSPGLGAASASREGALEKGAPRAGGAAPTRAWVISHSGERGGRTGLRCRSSESIPASPRAASMDSLQHRTLGKEGHGAEGTLLPQHVCPRLHWHAGTSPEGLFTFPCCLTPLL